MYAIITELDSETADKINQIRKNAISPCGEDPAPLQWPLHLSWQGAESYQIQEAHARIKMIADTFAPIVSRVDGVGIFTGKEPVLYLSVTRTPELSALNATLWEALSPLAESPNRYFSPQEWAPHISLMYGRPEIVDKIACVVEKLITTPLQIDIKLDHLSIGFYRGQEHGNEIRFDLTGRSDGAVL